MEIENSFDPEKYEEDLEATENRQGGGGGGRSGRKKEFRGSDERKSNKAKEARKGQMKNAIERHEHDEQPPEAEIEAVLRYVNQKDENNSEMPALNEYLAWLKKHINEEELNLVESELGNWEQMTASVHAGGSGRQTSRNARAGTHLITGIRATAEKSRQGAPNEAIVMDKLRERLAKHIQNWRVVLMTLGGRVDPDKLGEEVLTRAAGEIK